MKNIWYNEEKGRWDMEDCRLTITTMVNGEESNIIRRGTMQLLPLSAKLSYQDEDAIVHLQLDKNCAYIERKGDYTLSLHLVPEEQNIGHIGIMGSDGEIVVYTHKVAYSIGQDSLLLSLHYDLLFGEEKQEMKLRLLARYDKIRKEGK